MICDILHGRGHTILVYELTDEGECIFLLIRHLFHGTPSHSIQIELKKGRLLHGRIDTVSPSSGNSMIAKLVNPLFKRLDVREVASIHLLQYCRLTTDTIEVVHDNLWQTRISVTVTTIDDPAED